MAGDRLLEIEDLQVSFATADGTVRAVDGVSFGVDRGETLALVGESGSGKSVTSLAVMGLLPRPAARLARGRIRFDGRELTALPPAALRRIRGNEIGMIFQEPMTSLNPVLTVGEQIAESVRFHQELSWRQAWRRALEMLELVRVPEPAARANGYPHQMSGGMRQRVMIAMALACSPKLLIADEPTTALDVTIQAQILDLLRRLQAQLGMSILFITHDLGVVAEMASRVVVMYAGRIVEEAPVRPIFAAPRMPYTAALLRSIPRVDRAAERQDRLEAIGGSIPNPLRLPAGCAFHPRCRFAQPVCRRDVPDVEPCAPGHRVRCVRWRELDLGGASTVAAGAP